MIKFFVQLFFWLFVSPIITLAQPSFTPLREALNYREVRHTITFSYADDLIDRLGVSFNYQEGSLDRFFENVSKETGIVFEQAGENLFLVKEDVYDLCARLIDSDMRDGMPGVQVLVNGRPSNITTGADGYARFRKAVTFQDTVSFRFLGYDPAHVTVRELTREDCLTLPLEFSSTTLDEVVVSYLSTGINLSKRDHRMEIRTRDMALLPGETDGDVFLAVKNLPGISAPNGKAGNLQVRGSTTDQTLVLFDNIPIYHKGHYFGAISPYNPWIVETVSVYRSGFTPALGGRVGGVLELESKRSIPDSAIYKAGINSYYGAAFVNIPIGESVAINSAIRQSYPGNWRSPKLEAINEMVFQPSSTSLAEDNPTQDVLDDDFNFRDWNFNLSANLKNSQVFVSVLDVDNQQDVTILDRNNNSQQFTDYSLRNQGVNLQWLSYWSRTFNTNLSLMRSTYEYSSIIRIAPNNRDAFLQDNFNNEINDWYVKIESNYTPMQVKSNHLQFGYELNRHRVVNGRRGRDQGQPGTPVVFERLAFLHAFFVNYDFEPLDRWTVNLGVRSNAYSITNSFRLEPRASMNYQVNENWSVKSSAGSYSQYISQALFFDFEDTRAENLSWSLADDDRPFIKSSQWMLGGLWSKNDWVIDFEVYYKQVDELFTNSSNPPRGGGDAFVSGDLNIYGADLLVRKKWGALDTWISYSHLSTDMNFSALNQRSFKAYYEQPHVFNITGTVPWKKWKLSAGWHFSSGVPNFSQATFFPSPGPPQEPPAPGEPIPSETNDGRFSSQHQLDMAVVYDFSPPQKGWKGSFGLSLLNIYDRDNLVEEGEVTFGPNTSVEARYAIGFAPNLMITVQW